MQVSVNGQTLDYRQFISNTLIKGQKTLKEDSLSKLSDTETQKIVTELGGQIGVNQDSEMESMNKALFGRSTWISLLSGGYSYTSGIAHGHCFVPIEPNDIGKRETIDTPLGEMRIAVKIDDKMSVYLDQLSQLSAFDTNNDGFVGASDVGAKNLVLIGYDKDGAEVELNFLDVMAGINITQFFDDTKNNGMQKSFASLLRPEESHSQIKKENIIEFFKAFANKEGWIDFTDPDTAERIFSNNELDLSYRKKNADGSTRLQRIKFPSDSVQELRDMQAKGGRYFGWEYHAAKTLRNAGKDYVFNSKDVGALERLKNGSISYEYDSALRSRNGYSLNNAYESTRKELNSLIEAIDIAGAFMDNASGISLHLAHRFHNITGLNYTEENLARVKEGLASGGVEFLETINDHGGGFSDDVIGMQLNDLSGNITMLFSSGKEVTIAIEDLYSGNGELNVDEYGNRASVMNTAREMTQEELNELDFSQVGIKDESGTIVSLKDLGITAIQKATYADGRFLSFILTNSEGMQFNAQDLYNISFLTSGGLDKNHQQENNPESNSAFSNHTDKDSDSLTNKIRQISNPLVFPNKPQVDMRV